MVPFAPSVCVGLLTQMKIKTICKGRHHSQSTGVDITTNHADTSSNNIVLQETSVLSTKAGITLHKGEKNSRSIGFWVFFLLSGYSG